MVIRQTVRDRVTAAAVATEVQSGMTPIQHSMAMAIAVAATGCSSWQQTLYYSGLNWQRNECQRIPDTLDRERCLKQTDMTYEDYQREIQRPAK